MSGQVKGVFILKQMDTTLENIKKGDLFRVKFEGDAGTELSPWQVALADAVSDAEDGINVQADAVTIMVGKPEIVNLTMRKTGDFTRKEIINDGPHPGSN